MPNPKRLTIQIALLSVAFYQSSIAFANTWQIEAGLGVIAQQQPWVAIPTQQFVLPFVNTRYGPWQFSVTDDSLVSYHWSLHAEQQLNLQLGFGIRDAGYGAKSVPGLKKSKAAVFQGYTIPSPEAVLNARLNWRWFSLQAGQQINEEQEALLVKAGIQIPVWQNQQGAAVQVQLEGFFRNAALNQRLYGVNADNQDLSVGRPPFLTGNTLSPGITVQLVYPFAERWLMQASISSERMHADLADSPLLGRQRQTQAWLGIGYRF